MKIHLSNIKKYYGKNLVLDIKNLTLETGKIFGVFGFNGAGKSTLINIIGGLDKEYYGDVLYDGKKYSDDLIKNITVVMQKPILLHTTVYKNLEYPLKIRQIPLNIRQEKIQKALREFDIEKLSKCKAHLISGGEEKKVSLARGMIIEPKILLLDEPTANVDEDSIKIIEDKIKNFKKKSDGIILIITHSYKQVKRICDEIVYIENGKVGSIDEIF